MLVPALLAASVVLGMPSNSMRLDKRQGSAAQIPDCTIINDIFGFAFSNATSVRNNCCDIRPEFACTSETTPRIISINFNDRIFNMQILPSIAGLTELTLLSLRNGSIPGNLPTAFGSLTKLQYLDLGINKFQGSIPPQLGNLAALTFLSINNNALLDGNIPSELGNLKALQSLDLSQNALVGPVPTSITSLPALKTLYLQNNLLTGPQPTFAGTSNFIYNCFDGQKATELNSQCPASSSAALLPSGASKTPSSSGSSNNTVYNQDPSPPSASSGPPVAAIAGAVAGVLVAALIVAGIVIYKRRSTPTDNTIKVGGPPPPPNGYYHGENKYAYDSEYGPAASEDLKPLGAPPTTNSSTGSIMPPYAQSVSGSSSGYQTENTRNVAAYRVLPEKGGPALDEKSRDSKSGYGTNGGAVRDSFLDSQFSGSVRGSVQAPALDEKTMLRMVATEGSEKNANLFMQPGSGALASGSVDPTAWGVEQAAQWAAQIPGIGASVSAKIREHLINGNLLLELSRDDMRNELGLSKLSDRAVFEEHVKKLKDAAGLNVVQQELDATMPPSYNNLNISL